MPKHFSLYIKLSCQTLSKALDKSRNTPLTSSDGFASMLYKFRELLIVTGVHKSHWGKNLTDYCLKDCRLLHI